MQIDIILVGRIQHDVLTTLGDSVRASVFLGAFPCSQYACVDWRRKLAHCAECAPIVGPLACHCCREERLIEEPVEQTFEDARAGAACALYACVSRRERPCNLINCNRLSALKIKLCERKIHRAAGRRAAPRRWIAKRSHYNILFAF